MFHSSFELSNLINPNKTNFKPPSLRYVRLGGGNEKNAQHHDTNKLIVKF